MKVKIGSLVMWGNPSSSDYGCMGVVVKSQHIEYSDGDILAYFNVHWADGTVTEYDHTNIESRKIKVVKF